METRYAGGLRERVGRYEAEFMAVHPGSTCTYRACGYAYFLLIPLEAGMHVPLAELRVGALSNHHPHKPALTAASNPKPPIFVRPPH